MQLPLRLWVAFTFASEAKEIIIRTARFYIDSRAENQYNNSCVTVKHAGVAELADALDLGSSVYDVQVQVLSSALSQICGIEFIRMMRI